MPYDLPSSSGPLRLKGAKIKKPKKKSKDKPRSDLEKNLSTGSGRASSPRHINDNDNDKPTSPPADDVQAKGTGVEEDEERIPVLKPRKTNAELRFEEARRKKLLDLAESADSRPELMKTHKERVEELNTYLSRLSEHHDMPKIGPG